MIKYWNRLIYGQGKKYSLQWPLGTKAFFKNFYEFGLKEIMLPIKKLIPSETQILLTLSTVFTNIFCQKIKKF